MALLKRIEHDNGIVGAYHRISGISKNYNKLSIEVETYVDSAYREKEKERLALSEQAGDLITRLSVVTGAPKTDTTEKEAEEINEQLTHYNELCMVKQFFAFKTNVELPYTDGDDISFETLYEKLVSSDTVFEGAKKII